MKFILTLPEITSKELLLKGIVDTVFLPLPCSAYMYLKGGRCQIKNASFDRECLLIEHYIISCEKEYSLTIQATSNVYVLLMLFKGSIAYTNINGISSIVLHPGETILLFARQDMYNITFLDQKIELYTISILDTFSPILFHRNSLLPDFVADFNNKKINGTLPQKMDTYFIMSLKRLLKVPKNNKTRYENYLINRFSKLLSAYKGLNGKYSVQHTSLKINEIHSDLTIHILQADNQFIRRLARKNGMSISKMERLFKEKYGTTVRKFINEKKFELISDLLIKTEISLLELSMKFNFSSVSALNRAFKKHYGTTMRKFRGTYKNQPLSKK
ncbi:helix-turn-helix domain-containing protein [Sphingobacterium sp. NPDC055346]